MKMQANQKNNIIVSPDSIIDISIDIKLPDARAGIRNSFSLITKYGEKKIDY
jgi:hypothetical protein